MATFSLTDGTQSIPLIFDAATQPAYRLAYDGRIQSEQTNILTHVPDFGDVLPVRGIDPDMTVFVTLDIGSDSTTKLLRQGFDTPLNASIALKRWVDGCDQQALRYHIHKDVPKISLCVMLEDSTNETKFSVKWGFVDMGGSTMTDVSHESQIIDRVTIFLELEPYGEGVEQCVKNEQVNGDMFYEGGTAGLADKFFTLGAPTPTLDTVAFLTSGKSQKLVTAAAVGEGLMTTDQTVGVGVDVLGYAWILLESGGSDLTVELTNQAGTVIETKTLAPDDASDISDKTVKDAALNDWYRVSLSGTTPAATTAIRINIKTDSAAVTTFYVDNVYIQLDTDVIPDIWASDCIVSNRGDSENTADLDRTFIDIWGVPGDAKALMKMEIDIDTQGHTNVRNFLISRGIDGTFEIADQPYWIESDLFTSLDFATVVDVARSNDSYESDTPTAPATISATYTVADGDTARRILKTTRAVYGIVRNDATDRVTWSFDSGNPDNTFFGEGVLTNTTDWELIFLGILNGSKVLPDNPPDTANPLTTFTVTADISAGADVQVDFDAFIFFYIQDGYIVAQAANPILDGEEVWIVGRDKYFITEGDGLAEIPQASGDPWTLQPGFVSNRILMTFIESDNTHFLDDEFAVTLKIVPRTRHLLGTV